MPGLVPGIHVLATKQDVDGRDIGERSDAVLRTTMPGHDGMDGRAWRRFVLLGGLLRRRVVASRSGLGPRRIALGGTGGLFLGGRRCEVGGFFGQRLADRLLL